jgi:hypothetical protein
VRHEQVDDAAIERQLGTDDGEIDAFASREREERVRFGGADVDHPSGARNAGVARRTEDFGDVALLGKLPDERMLARAAPDDKYSHGPIEKRNVFRKLQSGCGTDCKDVQKRSGN